MTYPLTINPWYPHFTVLHSVKILIPLKHSFLYPRSNEKYPSTGIWYYLGYSELTRNTRFPPDFTRLPPILRFSTRIMDYPDTTHFTPPDTPLIPYVIPSSEHYLIIPPFSEFSTGKLDRVPISPSDTPIYTLQDRYWWPWLDRKTPENPRFWTLNHNVFPSLYSKSRKTPFFPTFPEM